MPVKLRGDNQGKKCKCKYPQCFLRFLRLTHAYKKKCSTAECGVECLLAVGSSPFFWVSFNIPNFSQMKSVV